VFAVGVGALVSSLIAIGAPPANESWRNLVSSNLQAVYESASSATSTAVPAKPTAPQSSGARFDAKGRVQVDVIFDCPQVELSAQLMAAGMVLNTTVRLPPNCVAEGWTPVASIPTLALIAGVKKINLPHYRTRRSPTSFHTSAPGAMTSALSAAGSTTIDGNGITIMAADQFRTTTGVSGAGVTVGVISDDAQNLAVIQGLGELPAVNVVMSSANPPPHTTPISDEGTMMLEEVHAVAPGASLAFCGPDTYQEYVGCLTNLIAAGATIITDDLSWVIDTMSAQSLETQQTQTLLTSNPNVMLFSASANNQKNYWQGSYTPDNSSGVGFTCNGQTDTYFESFGGSDINNWTSGGMTSRELVLEWADPFTANVSNFDLYVFNASGAFVACQSGAGSSEAGVGFPGGAFPSPGNYTLVIGTPDASLQGKFLKLIGQGDNADTFSLNTPGAPSSPQDFATGVFTIGAVDGSNGVGSSIEPYSNRGPIQLELPTPSTLQAPILVAPDKIFVDNVGTMFQTSIFGGTSAASPNAASVAALLRSAFPSLTPTDTIAAMETGATPIAAYGPVPNGTIGYGLVNAMGALATLPVPTISGAASMSLVGGSAPGQLTLTIGGTGPLTMSVSIDNTALIPAVSFNSGCTSSGACSVTVGPVYGQSGTAHVTFTVADGANRTASLVGTVTVTKPAPPQVLVTGQASQVVAMGAAVAPGDVVPSGTGFLTMSVSTSNQALLPVSGLKLSACGQPGVACTVAMTPVASQSGSAVVTVSAKDAYGQSGQGSWTLTVNAPPQTGGGGGGGGAFDELTLLALAGFALLAAVQRSGTSRRPANEVRT
jgi:hypothetical protein